MGIYEFHENHVKIMKTRKTENATWRKNGARPGPIIDPALFIIGALQVVCVTAGGNGFLLFLVFLKSRGGPFSAPFRPPSGPPPGDPESQEIRKVQNS